MSKKDENTLVAVCTTERAFREFILEATEEELDEAIEREGEDPSDLAAKGRSAAEAALGGGGE